MRKSTGPTLWLSILVLLCMSTVTYGQSATGRIVGTVQDTSGAVVPGASIEATNPETNTSFKTTSSDTGKYSFEALPPGSYTISVEQTNFKKHSTSQNILTANDTVTINIPLEPGSISETVVVTGTYEKVQTSQSGNTGSIVNERALETLPIANRNPLNLIAIQPGVVQGSNTGGGTHVFGARDRAINITLDGIDINETSAGSGTFSPVRTNPDSLQEYRIITSNPSAEFGRNSGAQVAMITKTGTNEFHGNLFEYHRNRSLNANEWELNRQGIRRRFLLRHQFGGSIGGPVILPRFGEGGDSYYHGRDRSFFFINMQYQRQTQTLEQVNTVYTDTARQGIFRYVVNNGPAIRNQPFGAPGAAVDGQGSPAPGFIIGTYNAATLDPRLLGLDPTVQSILSLTPLPNRFDVGDGLNTAGFSSLATRTDPQRDFTIRIDHSLNERHGLFGRYYFGQQDTVGDTTNDGAARFPGLPPIVATFRTPRNLALGLRSTLSSSTVNELILGGNHFKFDFAIPSNQDSRTTPVGLVLPTNPLSNSFGNRRTINVFQIIDNVSHTRGSHTFRAGVNLRWQQHYDVRGTVAGIDANPQYFLGGAVDPTTFRLPTACSTTVTTNCINLSNDRPRLQSFINDMLGKLNQVRVGLVDTGGQYGPPGTAFTIDAWYPEYDSYLQDDWKLRPNLTLNLGVRWEPKPKPYTRGPRKIVVPDKPFTLGAPAATDIRFVEGDLYKSDWNNFGPAIGVAWDPFKDGKTAVRGNFRVAFDRISTFTPSSAVYPAAPGATLAVSNTIIGQTDNRLRDGIPPLTPPAGSSPTSLATPTWPNTGLAQELLDPNFKTPTTYMWSLGVQRDLGRGFVAEAQYIGRAGRKLIGGYERNQVKIVENGFLDAFKIAKAGGESTLLNQLTAGHPSRNATETGAAFLRRFFTSTLVLNNVASLAASLNNTLLCVGGTGSACTGGTFKQLPDRNGLGTFFFNDYPQFLAGLVVIDSNSFSNYNAGIVQLQRRFQAGYEFGVSYTFSKSLDDKSYDPTFTRISGGTGQTTQSTPLDATNRRLTYGLSDFDRTHVFQAGGLLDLPFGPGKQFLSSRNPVLSRLVGGWTLTTGVVWQSGRPFTPVSGTNSFSNKNSSRAVYTGTNFNPRYQNDPVSGVPFLFTAEERAQFTIPGPGEYGNIGRNSFRLPPFFNMDASLIKKIPLRETMNLELRAQVFNLTNTPYYGFTGVTVGAVIPPTTFSRNLGTETSARIVEVAIKLNF